MEKDNDILERMVKALKNKNVPSGPSKELVNQTLSGLEESERHIPYQRIQPDDRFNVSKHIYKIAAAIVVFLLVGFGIGRISATHSPDLNELQSQLIPAVRKELLAEINRSLESSYANLSEQFEQSYRNELNRLGLQILSASNNATNERLTQLIDTLTESKIKERQWFTSVMEQMETNRIKDTVKMSQALVNVAQQTEQELKRTKEDMIHYLSYIQPGQSDPDALKMNNH